MNRNCSACNIKIDTNNYKKDRTVCKSCYNKFKRKNNNDNKNTLIQNQQTKLEADGKNVRTPIIGFSNFGKTYVKKYILLPKQDPICLITKILNQYPNNKVQTSDEIQPLEKYENSTIYCHQNMKAKLICF